MLGPPALPFLLGLSHEFGQRYAESGSQAFLSRERAQSARRWCEWHSPPSAAQRLCKFRTGPGHRCEADIADIRSVENKPDRTESGR